MCMKLFIVRSCYLCVYWSCVKLVSAGPMKGRLDFFFLKKIYDAFSKENGRCVYSRINVRCVYGMNGRCVLSEWAMRLQVNECTMRLWDEWTVRLRVNECTMRLWNGWAMRLCVFFFFEFV